MTKDKALEEMFLSQQPHFDDNADFMATLTRRLDAVEYVRHHQEATLRCYRMAMNSRIISATVLTLIISLGLMSIASNVYDILRIRHNF